MGGLRFVSVTVMVPEGLPLLPQIQGALAAHGETLRWAVTQAIATNGVRQLTIEAVVVTPACAV